VCWEHETIHLAGKSEKLPTQAGQHLTWKGFYTNGTGPRETLGKEHGCPNGWMARIQNLGRAVGQMSSGRGAIVQQRSGKWPARYKPENGSNTFAPDVKACCAHNV